MGSQIGGATQPGGAFSFVGATSETKTPTRTAANGLALEGKWCFTLKRKQTGGGAAATKKTRKAYLDGVEARRYKIGLKIKQNQTVDELAFMASKGFFQMVPDAAVTNELNLAFSADPEDKWVGFLPPPNVKRKPTWKDKLTVCYRYKLTVSPVNRVPQAIVAVTTYGDLAITAHHLKSVLLLADQEKIVRTGTFALVP